MVDSVIPIVDIHHCILHRLRGAAAMTDEERRMFSNRLRERDAEIAQLRAALQEIVRQGGAEDTLASIARRALEPKP